MRIICVDLAWVRGQAPSAETQSPPPGANARHIFQDEPAQHSATRVWVHMVPVLGQGVRPLYPRFQRHFWSLKPPGFASLNGEVVGDDGVPEEVIIGRVNRPKKPASDG